jgi:hypothetical protein
MTTYVCMNPNCPNSFKSKYKKSPNWHYHRSPFCSLSTSVPSDVPFSSTFSPVTEELSVNDSSSNMSYSFLLNASVDRGSKESVSPHFSAPSLAHVLGYPNWR